MNKKLVFCLFSLFLITQLTFAQNSEDESLNSGKLLFQLTCARCHGMQGYGGTGPDLSRPYLPRAYTDEMMADVIANGIPGTGMPSVWLLTPIEIEKITKWIRYLGNENDTEAVGNAKSGEMLFSESSCSTCHIIAGKGGSLGPNLSQIGLQRGQGYLISAISHPGENKPVGPNGFYKYLTVRIELKNGNHIEGMRINEDSFSIQIKDPANVLHSFSKDDILAIKKLKDRSLMPSFSEQFSKNEIDDISAYLTSLK